MDSFYSPFATNLRGLMDENGVSQQQLAQTIGKTRQTVSQYVKGISEPGYDTLVQIAGFFNVSVDYLLGVSPAKSTDTTIQDIVHHTGLLESDLLQLIAWNSLPDLVQKDISELTECEKEILLSANRIQKDLCLLSGEDHYCYIKRTFMDLISSLIHSVLELPPQVTFDNYQAVLHSEVAHKKILNGKKPLSFNLTKEIEACGYQLLGPHEASRWYLSFLTESITKQWHKVIGQTAQKIAQNAKV